MIFRVVSGEGEGIVMGFAATLYVSTDPRRADRRPADIGGTLRGAEGVPTDVRVVDMSRYGFRCTTTADLREGDAVAIGLRGNGDGRAIVRWRRGAQIGCEFINPLTEAEAHAAVAADVVVAMGQSPRTEPVLRGGAAPWLSAGWLLTALLALSLLIDLLNGYLNRAL